MRLIYLSTDDVNRSLVRGWGQRHGVLVLCPRDQDHTVAEPGDIVVMDVDHLPSGQLDRTITRLRDTLAGSRVAAHGYDTSEVEKHLGGLKVRPHLSAGLLEDLARVSISSSDDYRHRLTRPIRD